MSQIDDFPILQANRTRSAALSMLQDCEEALVHVYATEGGLSAAGARKQAELVSEFLVSHGRSSIVDDASSNPEEL